jgi:hypothetical protein
MARYNTKEILKSPNHKQYYRGKIYPNIPLSEDDSYVVTTVGDRLDYLAYIYYGESELWWVISVANNNVTKGSIFPIPGTQLRIPADLGGILSLFNDFNKTR